MRATNKTVEQDAPICVVVHRNNTGDFDEFTHTYARSLSFGKTTHINAGVFKDFPNTVFIFHGRKIDSYVVV